VKQSAKPTTPWSETVELPGGSQIVTEVISHFDTIAITFVSESRRKHRIEIPTEAALLLAESLLRALAAPQPSSTSGKGAAL
jgi:hypothetical protein